MRTCSRAAGPAGWTTRYCAAGHEKNGVYRGVLRDRDGNALPDTKFSGWFDSRRHAEAPLVGGFSTDSSGRYCIVWARESSSPSAYVAGRPAANINAEWEPLAGAQPPPGCQPGDQGIPWNRAEDLRSRWQYRTVAWSGLAGVALLAMGLLSAGTAPAMRFARAAGIAFTVATTIGAFVAWHP